jgi:hypothetical protein
VSSSFPGPSGSNPFQSPPPEATNPPRSRTWLWLLLFGGLACLCLCSGLCILPIGYSLFQVATQQEEIRDVVEGCLHEIDNDQFDDALARFSERAVKQGLVTHEQLEALADNAAFQEFDSLVVTNVMVNATVNSDPKLPQGVVANVDGTVAYNDGGTGKFKATLEKQDGLWKLHALEVTREAEPKFVDPAAAPPET